MSTSPIVTVSLDPERDLEDAEQELEDLEAAVEAAKTKVRDLRKQVRLSRSRRSSSGDWTLPSGPEAWIKFIVVMAIAFFASLVVANVALDLLKEHAFDTLEKYRTAIAACIVLITVLYAYLKTPRD